MVEACRHADRSIPPRAPTTSTWSLIWDRSTPPRTACLRLVLEIDGEIIVRLYPEIGYLHTGIEKTCEAKFYQQVVPLTDRINYLDPLSNNLCYAWLSKSCCIWKFPRKPSGSAFCWPN